jgi:drug/metabolite transporter (DMT)-like permease
MQNAKLLHYFHLHFIVFIWGFTAVLGALISIDAIPLVWFRMLIAAVLILLFIRWKKEKLRFPPKVIAGFALAGVIIALHWLTFFGAIKAANVSVTLVVMSTGAFFASFLEPLFFKRKIIGYEVFFGVLAIAGLVLIFSFETSYTLGIILALISAFLSALFAVINGIYIRTYKASTISFYELLAGVVAISIYLGLAGKFDRAYFQLSQSDWIYILILASVCTAYAFVASTHVMKWLSPYTVMLTINLEPVYGIILAVLILGDSENMSPQFYYGAAIILLTVITNGILKNTMERKKRRLGNT